MDFEITPGAKVTTNRNLALISLHHDFTKYLEKIDERVRPIELPLLEFRWVGEVYYYLKSSWQNQISSFAKTFELKYPEVEQVYVFSIYSWGFPPFKNLHLPHMQERLDNALEQIILKRYLMVDYPAPYCNGYLSAGYHPTNSIEIKKIMDKSLKFNSW